MNSRYLAVFIFGVAACTSAAPQSEFSGGAGPENAVCITQLVLTGQQQQQPGGPPDDGTGSGIGCRPTGLWNVTVQETGPSLEFPQVPQCSRGQVTALQSAYSYQVTVDEDNLTTILPDDESNRTKITGEGGGKCAGTFEHIGPDSVSMVLLKPFVDAGGVVSGQGLAMVLNRSAK